MGGHEETGDEEKKQQEADKTESFNVDDFKIIKEGEAEILMHAKNEVFYNKAQVSFPP